MIRKGRNWSKWSEMVKTGQKLSAMVKMVQMVKNGQNWSKLIKMARNGTGFLGSQSSHDVFRGQNLETMRHGNIFRSINQNVKRDFLPLAFDKFN